jgi:hypothetical protein
MKAIQIKLYTFKELGKIAKQKALTDFRYLNVDFNWWEDEYQDFINLCAEMGITVDEANIKFKGFYSQGDGSAFSAVINFSKLADAIRLHSWKRYAPTQDFKFPELTVDARVMRLVGKGLLPSEPQIIARYRFYDVVTDLGIYIVSQNKDYDRIFEELEKLEEWLRQIAKTLNAYLYQSLQNQYEFLTADNSVKESLLLNEYLFTADGRAANHLHELAIHHNKTA